MLDMGWNGNEHLHTTPIHISLISKKVWIQYDDNEEGIATDLIAAGILKKIWCLVFVIPRYDSTLGLLWLEGRKEQ